LENQAGEELKVISMLTGVEPKSNVERNSLIERLRNARIKIGDALDDWELLKNWRKINHESISETEKMIKNKTTEIKKNLSDQYKLWLNNKKQKGLLELKLQAARYCKHIDEFETCPVCNKELEQDIKIELKELSERKVILVKSIRQLVSDYKEEINSCVNDDIETINIGISPAKQIRIMIKENVWDHIKDLGRLSEEFGKKAKKIIDELPEYIAVGQKKYFGEESWDAEFLDKLSELELLE